MSDELSCYEIDGCNLLANRNVTYRAGGMVVFIKFNFQHKNMRIDCTTCGCDLRSRKS